MAAGNQGTDVTSQLVCDEKTAGTGDVGAGLKPAPYKRLDFPVTSQLVCDVTIAVSMMAGTSPATTENGVPFDAIGFGRCFYRVRGKEQEPGFYASQSLSGFGRCFYRRYRGTPR